MWRRRRSNHYIGQQSKWKLSGSCSPAPLQDLFCHYSPYPTAFIVLRSWGIADPSMFFLSWNHSLSMGVVKMARYWPIKTRKRTMNTQPSSWNKLGQNETITWLKRDLIIAGPTPSVQEGLIFLSRMVIIGQEMVRENYSSRSGKSQRISLWVRENLSLWKKSRLSEILRVHIFFYQFMDTPRDLLKA